MSRTPDSKNLYPPLSVVSGNVLEKSSITFAFVGKSHQKSWVWNQCEGRCDLLRHCTLCSILLHRTDHDRLSTDSMQIMKEMYWEHLFHFLLLLHLRLISVNVIPITSSFFNHSDSAMLNHTLQVVLLNMMRVVYLWIFSNIQSEM